jgi:hypothetical protein
MARSYSEIWLSRLGGVVRGFFTLLGVRQWPGRSGRTKMPAIGMLGSTSSSIALCFWSATANSLKRPSSSLWLLMAMKRPARPRCRRLLGHGIGSRRGKGYWLPARSPTRARLALDRPERDLSVPGEKRVSGASGNLVGCVFLCDPNAVRASVWFKSAARAACRALSGQSGPALRSQCTYRARRFCEPRRSEDI